MLTDLYTEIRRHCQSVSLHPLVSESCSTQTCCLQTLFLIKVTVTLTTVEAVIGNSFLEHWFWLMRWWYVDGLNYCVMYLDMNLLNMFHILTLTIDYLLCSAHSLVIIYLFVSFNCCLTCLSCFDTPGGWQKCIQRVLCFLVWHCIVLSLPHHYVLLGLDAKHSFTNSNALKGEFQCFQPERCFLNLPVWSSVGRTMGEEED